MNSFNKNPFTTKVNPVKQQNSKFGVRSIEEVSKDMIKARKNNEQNLRKLADNQNSKKSSFDPNQIKNMFGKIK